MFYNARQGNDARLQYCYYEIEKLTPIFNVCIEKRLAGVANRQWDITTIDESPEATKQAEFVKKIFLVDYGNFTLHTKKFGFLV